MLACSLVHIAYARSTNIDPSAAGALPSNFSQPTQEGCLTAPEAARPLLSGSWLCSACKPNGWATFSLLVLAPDHLNRDGGGNNEVIRPDCQTVAQRGRNSAPCHCQSLAPDFRERTHQLRAGEAQPLPRCPATTALRATSRVADSTAIHSLIFGRWSGLGTALQLSRGGVLSGC